jgi:hypothetical protein
MTRQAKKEPMELVQLASGERLEAAEQTDHGVMTDAGLIPWDQIEGFWTWSRTIGRRVFIPVDHGEKEDQ